MRGAGHVFHFGDGDRQIQILPAFQIGDVDADDRPGIVQQRAAAVTVGDGRGMLDIRMAGAVAARSRGDNGRMRRKRGATMGGGFPRLFLGKMSSVTKW